MEHLPIDWWPGAERIVLWEENESFVFVITSLSLRKVSRFTRLQVANILPGGLADLSDDELVIGYLGDALMRAGYAAARTPPELGASAAWVVIN
jgi:hypothetical protein